MTDACDSDVQKGDPWSSHRPSTPKGTGTSRLQYNINASNTVVSSTDSDLATKKDATKRFTQAVAEPIRAEPRFDETTTKHDGTK